MSPVYSWCMMQLRRYVIGARACCAVLLVVLIVVTCAGLCKGDQLQWNTLSICRDAAETIARLPVLVSFCSLADEDYVEVWLLRGLHATETPTSGLYEITVSAKGRYRSDRPFSAGDFPVPEEQWHLHEAETHDGYATAIDLAYVYVYIGGRSFRCLGHVLGLPCIVKVETIQLPNHVMAELASGLGPWCLPSSWPLDIPVGCPWSDF